MRDIKEVKIDKYNNDNYKEIAFGIYLNVDDNTYNFTFEADKIDQYPLEDLLDQYSVYCSEYYGQKYINSTGEEKGIAEVKTLSNSKIELIKILNFSTIVGKEIVNAQYCDKDILCVSYGQSNIYLNNKKIVVPILAYRNDRRGLISFDAIYPEIQLKNSLTSGDNYKVENFDNDDPNYILLKDGEVILVFEGENEIKRIEVRNK